MTNEELISMAKKAMENSYSPYSEFRVGAAALGKSGTVYTGVNIENASYGATVCAERCAMFKGISEGERSFSRIAVVCGVNRPAPPCGMCLQVMTEFMEPETGEILLEENGGIKVYKLKELIPLAFKL